MPAVNTGFKGIDVRQTGSEIVFRAFLQTSAGGLVTTGTTNFYLMELQSDGTIKTYDFNDNTFKTTAVTTETLAATYRKSNNATTDTGLWTAALSTLTGFTVGAVYLVRVNNTGASPTDQLREFQYGSGEGDFAVTADGTGIAYLKTDLTDIAGAALSTTTAQLGANVVKYNNQTAQTDANNLPKVDVEDIKGTASAGQAGYAGVDWGQVANKTTTNALTNTTVNPNLALALDETAVGATVGAALNAARVQGIGKWAISGDTLTLYASDNTTVVKAFTLAPGGGPYTSRA